MISVCPSPTRSRLSPSRVTAVDVPAARLRVWSTSRELLTMGGRQRRRFAEQPQRDEETDGSRGRRRTRRPSYMRRRRGAGGNYLAAG